MIDEAKGIVVVQPHEDANENVNEQGPVHPARRVTRTRPEDRPEVGACQGAPGGQSYANFLQDLCPAHE